MVTMSRNIKNSGNELTDLDFPQVLKSSYNNDNQALDVVSVDSLVHERFYQVSCTYVTLPGGCQEVETITYYGLGKNQLQYIDCAGTPAGKGQITLLSFYNQVPGNLDGKFFTIYDSAGSVGVWFDLDGSSIHPVTGALRDISIPIATGDAPSTLASKLAAILTIDSEFYSTTSGFNAAIITRTVGPKTNSSSGTSGLILNTQLGTSSMNNTWFSISNVGDSSTVVAWYNVDGLGAYQNPIPGALALEIPLLGTDTDAQVAQKTSDAINSVDNLFVVCWVTNNRVTAKYGQFGPSNGIINGNTRNTIILQDLGVTCPIVAKLLIKYGINNEIAKIERITVGENTN